MPDTQTLQQMTARFAPTEITADLSKLSDADRRVLAKLVEASKIVDGLFLRQVWAGNDAMLADLARDQSPEGRARLHYFLINKGPWSRLDHNAVVRAGRAGRSRTAPTTIRTAPRRRSSSAGSSRCRRPSGPARPASSPSIRRAGSSFTLVPYNVEYQGELARAAGFLRDAAQLTNEPTLKAFLTKRADAFLSNDYYESDVAWMELEGAIEPTIGPYEVYEDELFNYKAGVRGLRHGAGSGRDRQAAEARRASCRTSRITCRSIRSSAIRSSARLRRSPSSTRSTPSGDGNRGVQTAAFNLPNDERVVREKGTKRVMLKNVQDAKFAEDAAADLEDRAAAGRSGRARRSTPSSRTSSCTS